jgi:hypothetical protein
MALRLTWGYGFVVANSTLLLPDPIPFVKDGKLGI